MTPLAAREPYTAAAAASLRTVIDSISLGLIVAIPLEVFVISPVPPATTGIPSTTQRGAFEALIDELPRIRICDWAPGWPEAAVTCTPASLPERALSTEVTGVEARPSPFTEVTDPVTASRLAEP